MKQLQNNFTTPEQSKKLLELGVPANSADCVYDCALIGGEKYYSLSILEDELFSAYKRIWEDPCTDIIPCWSVGRLIEIYEKCVGLYYKHSRDDGHNDNLAESIIYKLESAIDSGNNYSDLYPIVNFSKLED